MSLLKYASSSKNWNLKLSSVFKNRTVSKIYPETRGVSSAIKQKDESPNRCYIKTKQVKFSVKKIFLTTWCV